MKKNKSSRPSNFGKPKRPNPPSSSASKNSNNKKPCPSLSSKKRVVSESTRRKMSDSISKNIASGNQNGEKPHNRVLTTPFSKKLWHYSEKMKDSFFADSLAEALRMHQLDADIHVKRWTKKHGIRIPYLYIGKPHYTIPDFFIEYDDGTFCIEEIKGKITPKELVKKDYTENYSLTMGYRYKFTTTKDLDVNKEYTNFLKLFKSPNAKKKKRKPKQKPNRNLF